MSEDIKNPKKKRTLEFTQIQVESIAGETKEALLLDFGKFQFWFPKTLIKNKKKDIMLVDTNLYIKKLTQAYQELSKC